MEKILLTGGMSAFAQRVARLFPGSQLVFADSHPIPTPLLQSGKYLAIPAASKPSFVHELLKLCLDYGITIVVPLRKEEMLPLSKSKLLFEEYDKVVLLPSIETLQKTDTIINPTSHDYPHIAAVDLKHEIVANDDTSELRGIYALDDAERPKLCCIV